MRYIEKNISQFIESQFPSLYREEGPILIEFVKSYFEWMESEGNTLYKTRRLLDYRDIDTSLDEYLEYFRNKYAQNLDLNTKADKRLLIKNIQDLYKSKGSERSYEILFRSIYNKDIRFYYPGNDILRVSDGEWVEGRYLEISSYVKNIQDFVGKEIRGYKSGASALVENYSQRIVNNKVIDVLEISHLKGAFDYGERIYPSNQIGQPIAQIILPRTVGSLTAIGVIDGGSNFEVGDILDVIGKGGKGKAKVTSTFAQQGRVTFDLENGGTGYSMNAVTQVFPQMQLTVNNVIGNFNNNQLLFQTDNANTMVANGIIMDSNSSVITIKIHTPGFEKNKEVRSAQKLILSPTSGTFSNGELIYQSNGTANIATGTIISIIPGVSNTAYYVANISGNFVQSVYNISGNTFVVRGNTSGANGFLFETIGSPGTGTAMVANIVGGGVGATFRVGAIYDKEIVTINSDYIRNYVNTRLMLINESSPLTGTVDVTNGQSNVVGTSTLFTSQVTVGGYIQVSNGASKEILQVNSIVNNTLLTVNGSFSNTQTGVNLYVDQINYMFPKVSSIADSENLSTILQNALTYNELEIGTIQYLSGINPGTGYSLDPYASVVEPLVAAMEIPSLTGIKGADAIVTAKAGTSNGIAMGVTVIDSGFGYEEGERLELSQTNSAFSVTGSAIVSENGKQAGYWKSTKGFLDSDKYIQDSKYYQQFSYEIQTDLNFNDYKNVVKELLHTAGTEFFGKFFLNDNNLISNITSESIISNTDIVLPNNYPTIQPSFVNLFSERLTIDPRITFSRTSNATYVDSSGIIRVATANIPRFDHNPNTLESLGILIEASRTNRALYSANTLNSVWFKNNAIVNSSIYTTAPDGSNNAFKIINSKQVTGEKSVRITQSNISITANTVYTLSCYVKPQEMSVLALRFVGANTSGQFRAWFDLTNKTVNTPTTNGTATYISAKIEESGNGWFRCSITGIPDTTSTSGIIQIYNSRSRSTVLLSDAEFNDRFGLYVWGIQLEQNNEVSSYIPTTSAIVTRAFESVFANAITSEPWFNPNEGTIFYEVPKQSLFAANTNYPVYSFDDGVNYNNSIGSFIALNSSGNTYSEVAFIRANSTAVVYSTRNVNVANTNVKMAMSYKQNYFSSSVNGSNNIIVTTGDVPVVTKLNIGFFSSTIPRNKIHIKTLAYYPKQLTDLEVKALTL